MSRVGHPAGPWPRVRVACHVPAAGVATSTNQKYGGPPCRSSDLTATFPLGATSESSPSRGFSDTTRTRKGAPFHGAIGAGKIATSVGSSQSPNEFSARAPNAVKARTKNPPATSNNAVAATESRRVRNKVPLPNNPKAHSSTWLGHNCAQPENYYKRASVEPIAPARRRYFRGVWTFNWRFLTRNPGPDSQSPLEPP